ncbi:hypothetical protein NL676_015471 [Syzygium grande]|nr:hypothetical protein NL676_015471 [Syzygium grande]
MYLSWHSATFIEDVAIGKIKFSRHCIYDFQLYLKGQRRFSSSEIVAREFLADFHCCIAKFCWFCLFVFVFVFVFIFFFIFFFFVVCCFSLDCYIRCGFFQSACSFSSGSSALYSLRKAGARCFTLSKRPPKRRRDAESPVELHRTSVAAALGRQASFGGLKGRSVENRSVRYGSN